MRKAISETPPDRNLASLPSWNGTRKAGHRPKDDMSELPEKGVEGAFRLMSRNAATDCPLHTEMAFDHLTPFLPQLNRIE